jgi:hypothetical protein
VRNFPRSDVENNFTVAYSAIGEPFGANWPVSQTDYEFGVKFWRLSEGLINEGKIKAHKPDVRSGGLEAIPQGLKDLEEGKVSGVKLVYVVD